MRWGLACSTGIYFLAAGHIQHAENICSQTDPSLYPTPCWHALPQELWCSDGGQVPTSHCVVFSWGTRLLSALIGSANWEPSWVTYFCSVCTDKLSWFAVHLLIPTIRYTCTQNFSLSWLALLIIVYSYFSPPPNHFFSFLLPSDFAAG